WRQFNTIASNFRQNGWAWSHDGGKTWTFPGTIQSRFNSDPVLDTDIGGNFYYLSYPGGRSLRVFKSTDSGKTWSAGTAATGGDKPWMIVDKSSSSGRGNIYAIWQVLHGPNTFIRSTNGGLSFSSAIRVASTPTFGTLAVDAAGNLYAAGLLRQNFGTFVLAKSTNAKNALQTPAFSSVFVNMGGRMAFARTPNPAGLLGQAQVVTDPSRPNHVYMLCSVDPPSIDPMDVHFVRSTNGGSSFSAPVRVNDDSSSSAWQWFGTMSVAPNGRIDVVWNDTRASSSARLSETHYAYSYDAGATWSKNVPVSPQWNSGIGWPRQNKIGDYYHMLSDKAKANLAYSATFNGEQDVYYLRLGDCNGNGVHDGIDLRSGASFDSNKNTIPDECELCQKDLGSGGGLRLTVCGDDLTKAGSKATLLLAGGPARSPVVLLLSLGRLSPPLPLPGGGALVPDLFRSPSLIHVPGSTDSKGRFGMPLGGGVRSAGTVFGQAVMIQGTKTPISNAVEIKIGS
ncbi:MAG: hypothetical protein ACE5F1_17565, partial [Planctomycetota bacterium]